MFDNRGCRIQVNSNLSCSSKYHGFTRGNLYSSYGEKLGSDIPYLTVFADSYLRVQVFNQEKISMNQFVKERGGQVIGQMLVDNVKAQVINSNDRVEIVLPSPSNQYFFVIMTSYLAEDWEKFLLEDPPTVISTWQFLDENHQNETSSWRSYEDSQFKLSYPPQWSAAGENLEFNGHYDSPNNPGDYFNIDAQVYPWIKRYDGSNKLSWLAELFDEDQWGSNTCSQVDQRVDLYACEFEDHQEHFAKYFWSDDQTAEELPTQDQKYVLFAEDQALILNCQTNHPVLFDNIFQQIAEMAEIKEETDNR